MTAGPEVFVRGRPTVLSYGMLGAYAFWLYAFGPALALLRAELGFSYTMLSVYSAMWAAGSILAGVVFPLLAARAGRRALLWWPGLLTAAGAALFIGGGSVPTTLAAALVMGWAGTTVQITTQSVLADQHGARRDTAFVESNIGAGVAAVVAPLALGALQSASAGWRIGMMVPAVAMAVLYLLYRRQALPAAPSPADGGTPRERSRLSWVCRLLCLLVAVGIGVEFCVVYFGAELLTDRTPLSVSAATTAMAAFYAGILLGRLAGARLTGRPGRTVALVAWSLTITLAGLLAMCSSSNTIVVVLGLFVAGAGIANQFPLVLALALEAAPGNIDTANARAQSLGGIVVLASPFLLGTLADHFGMTLGFAVAPALTAVSVIVLVVARRGGRREPSGGHRSDGPHPG